MTEGFLVVKDVTYVTKAKSLLKNVSFEVGQGELVGIIGPNGAGKTTLLKTIIGYLQASSGSLWIQGQTLDSMSSHDRARRLSYLSQETGEGFPFVVKDIVALGAYAAQKQGQYSTAALSQRVSDLLASMDILHLQDRIFTELSGGEKQLVQFARLLLQDAELMLLDEPTANLDLGHEFDLMHALRSECDKGKTALITLHNLNSAAEFCDRVILIDQGAVVADGKPDQVITQGMIHRLYTEHAMVALNPHSGNINVLPKRRDAADAGIRVHVIGGAGSAIRVSKLLRRLGCTVTGGIAHQDDSDAAYWQAAGIAYLEVPAFGGIEDSDFVTGLDWIAAADVTVLCDFPIGLANARNLHLAAASKNLIVLAEHGDQPRFYGGDLQLQYDALLSAARVVEFEDLPAAIALKVGEPLS